MSGFVGNGGVNPALRVTTRATEGRARPRGGVRPDVVAALSRRGSRQFNRRANGEEAPARGAVGRGPAALRALIPGEPQKTNRQGAAA
jgi:hypothetical protein